MPSTDFSLGSYCNHLLDVVTEIVNYARAKAIYEVQCETNRALAELRQTRLECEADQMNQLTRNLNMTKIKLRILKTQVQGFPPEYQDALEPLFQAAEEKMEELRKKRDKLMRH